MEIIIEKQPNSLMIPVRANFDKNGKPIVYVQKGKSFVVREIKVGKRNDDNVVVTSGLQEGEIVALEDPLVMAKKAKKKL